MPQWKSELSFWTLIIFESSTEELVKRGGPIDPEELVVELTAMEIRTFLLDIDYLQVFGP